MQLHVSTDMSYEAFGVSCDLIVLVVSQELHRIGIACYCRRSWRKLPETTALRKTSLHSDTILWTKPSASWWQYLHLRSCLGWRDRVREAHAIAIRSMHITYELFVRAMDICETALSICLRFRSLVLACSKAQWSSCFNDYVGFFQHVAEQLNSITMFRQVFVRWLCVFVCLQ